MPPPLFSHVAHVHPFPFPLRDGAVIACMAAQVLDRRVLTRVMEGRPDLGLELGPGRLSFPFVRSQGMVSLLPPRPFAGPPFEVEGAYHAQNFPA